MPNDDGMSTAQIANAMAQAPPVGAAGGGGGSQTMPGIDGAIQVGGGLGENVSSGMFSGSMLGAKSWDEGLAEAQEVGGGVMSLAPMPVGSKIGGVGKTVEAGVGFKAPPGIGAAANVQAGWAPGGGR